MYLRRLGLPAETKRVAIEFKHAFLIALQTLDRPVRPCFSLIGRVRFSHMTLAEVIGLPETGATQANTTSASAAARIMIFMSVTDSADTHTRFSFHRLRLRT